MSFFSALTHGLGNILSGGAQNQLEGPAAQMADPWAKNRPQYQNQLNALMADPSSITKTPGYEFQFGQGMDALMRSEAASGNIGGKSMTDAIAFGQNLAMTSFQNWESMLADLAGVDAGSPGAASEMYAKGATAGASGLKKLGSMFFGEKLFGDGSGGGGGGPMEFPQQFGASEGH